MNESQQEMLDALNELLAHLHGVFVVGDLNTEEFMQHAQMATRATIMKAQLTSRGETK